MDLQIQVSPRKTGKSAVRKMRAQKAVPGVLYGAVKENVNFSVEEKAIAKYNTQKFENAIYTLSSQESKVNGVKVLMKEVHVHPVTRRPLHVDFLAIDMNKEVRVYVELRLEGKAAGIGNGGLLEQLIREVEVQCLPAKIPQFITADVTPLDVGQALHLNDIKFPEGVKPTAHENLAIATVTIVKEEVLTPQVAAPAAGEAAPGAEGAVAAPAAAGDAKAAAPAAGAKPGDAKAADAKAAPAKDKK